MDAVLNVVGTIGAIWLAVSILLAVAWALGGRKIFRKPPQPRITIVNSRVSDEAVRECRQADAAPHGRRSAMSERPDYGAAGCCGPAAFAMLAFIVGGIAALVAVMS